MRRKPEAAAAETPKAPESGTNVTEPARSESGTCTNAPSALTAGAPLKWTEEVLDASLIEYEVAAYDQKDGIAKRIHDYLWKQRSRNGKQKYLRWEKFARAELDITPRNAVIFEGSHIKPSDPLPMGRRPGYPKLPAHPAADAFPMMSEKELEELAADIKANGQREDIIVDEGAILDGRNRYVACQIAGVRPKFKSKSISDGDPVAFVVAKNLLRRHMDETQRAMVAARLATMKQGARTDLANLPPIGGMSQSEAAKTMNVSERAVERASAVLKKGDPEIVAAVESKEVSLGDASNVIALPPPEQREALKRKRRGEARTLTKATKEKPAHEAAKDAEPTTTTPKAKTYRVLTNGRREDKPDVAYATIEVEGKRIEVEIDIGKRPDKWRAFESVDGGDA